MFLYSLQPEDENLVTLEDTSASAVLQKDGTVVCTHEILSPIRMLSQYVGYTGSFQAQLGKSKRDDPRLRPSIVNHNSSNVHFPLSYPISVFALRLNQPQHWSFILLVSFLVSFPDSMRMS